jgi:orotidine-5'-phosphate decarboxylase
MDSFAANLDRVAERKKTMVCVGLDPDPARMAIPDVAEFNKRIIDATHHLVAAYKPQMAYYEALGIPGMHALEKTIKHIRDVAPEVLIIGDGKRGDMGATATAYATAMFEVWDFDVVTVNAYQGSDTVEPFLQYPGRGVFIVCRTSNPSSRDFQDLRIAEEGSPQLFEKVAEAAERWDIGGNIGLVVGATFPKELRLLRADHQTMPILIPGVGAQGGDVAAAARAGVDGNGRGMLINSSRGITYASKDPKEYARYARLACESLRNQINVALETTPGTEE